MMRSIITMLALAALALPAAAGEDGVRLDVVAGGQALDSGGLRDAKLHEYGLVPEGAVIPLLRLTRGVLDDPYFLWAEGTDILRENQRYAARLEKTGLARLSLVYDQIPHRWSHGSVFLLSERPGLHTLDDNLREDLEEAATGANPTADLPPLVRQALESTAHRTDIGLRRDAHRADAEIALHRNVRIRAQAGLEKIRGDRTTNAGTYTRSGSPDSTFDRERFDVRGQEIPETVDWRTVNAGITTDWRGPRGFVEAGVQARFFRNELESLQWDNPFEAGPGERTVIGQSQANRGRYARGQMAVAPDNDYMRAQLRGMLRVGSKVQVAATVAGARMAQDQDFLPFTLNEAVLFPGADGTLGTADDVSGTSLSLLPAASLDGEVRTQRADVRLTARPLDRVTVEASARYYGYDNETPRLDFPGYAAFSESAFRRGIGQKENGVDVLFNDSSEYVQRRYGLTAGWAFVAPFHLTVGAERITWDYTGRQVDKTDEDVLSARLRGDGPRAIGWSVFFENGKREHSGEYEIGLELSKNRMFDVWDRDRQRLGAEVDAEIGASLVATLSGSRTADDYPGKLEEAAHPYGLQESFTNEVALWLNYDASERLSFFGGGGVDVSEWKSLLITKTPWGLEGGANDYKPENRWFRNQEDQTVWGGLGVKAAIVPGRFTAEAAVNVNAYTGDVVTTNPETPTVNSAVAVDWPEIKTTLREVRISLNHKLVDGIGIGLNYAFVPFTLEDPAWDSLRPYMQGVVTEIRTGPDDIKPANVSRYLFMDSRYGETTSHIASLVVTASLP